jgi:hypothetical protein
MLSSSMGGERSGQRGPHSAGGSTSVDID